MNIQKQRQQERAGAEKYLFYLLSLDAFSHPNLTHTTASTVLVTLTSDSTNSVSYFSSCRLLLYNVLPAVLRQRRARTTLLKAVFVTDY